MGETLQKIWFLSDQSLIFLWFILLDNRNKKFDIILYTINLPIEGYNFSGLSFLGFGADLDRFFRAVVLTLRSRRFMTLRSTELSLRSRVAGKLSTGSACRSLEWPRPTLSTIGYSYLKEGWKLQFRHY